MEYLNILRKVNAIKVNSKSCKLYHEEKLAMAAFKCGAELLNERSEIMAKWPTFSQNFFCPDGIIFFIIRFQHQSIINVYSTVIDVDNIIYFAQKADSHQFRQLGSVYLLR